MSAIQFLVDQHRRVSSMLNEYCDMLDRLECTFDHAAVIARQRTLNLTFRKITLEAKIVAKFNLPPAQPLTVYLDEILNWPEDEPPPTWGQILGPAIPPDAKTFTLHLTIGRDPGRAKSCDPWVFSGNITGIEND